MTPTHPAVSSGQTAPAPTRKLTPLRVPKASDILASDLRERILTGEFTVGNPLPTERDMVQQTSMSRATVREALRILEVQGLIAVRTGRSGGAFVTRPDRSAVSNSVDLLIRGRQIKMADLLETREAIEPQCAALAARHRTDADLARLDELNETIEAAATSSLDEFLRANVNWHLAVAAASQNELLAGLMNGLSEAIYQGTNNEGFVSDDVRSTAVRAHTSITRAIRDSDDAAATRRMERHVHSYAEEILEVEIRTQIDVPGQDFE